ncbi:hypothetical protein AMTR_s00034p00225550 [Amborella trichopoda]|uniref:Uncharacterized protein n=1 Tax=Amborella trichopoda TaxID=13333 RepID=W1PVY7_AMBTC|nr:hypothetical protein AMTR_s00034p00225550 [Amborella trichopoda]
MDSEMLYGAAGLLCLRSKHKGEDRKERRDCGFRDSVTHNVMRMRERRGKRWDCAFVSVVGYCSRPTMSRERGRKRKKKEEREWNHELDWMIRLGIRSCVKE